MSAVLRPVLGVLLAPLAFALAGLAALVRRPALTVVMVVALTAVPGGSDDASAGMSVTPADLASAVLVAIIAVRALRGDAVLPRRLWPLPAALLAALGAATLASQDVAASLPGFVRFAQLFVLIPVAVVMAVRDGRDRALVLGSIVALGLFQGAIGVYQSVTRTGASYQGEYVRAVGTFGALDVMAMSVVVGCALLIAVGAGLTLHGRPRAAAWTAAALLTVPLALSLSRGTWIAVAAAAMLTVVLAGRRAALLTGVFGGALAVVLIGGFGIGSDTLAERITSITSSTSAPDQSVRDRYALWDAALGMWRDHPVTGVGPKNFTDYRDTYASVGLSSGSDVDDPSMGFQRQPLLSPHNMYLLVLSEQGLIGALAFVGAFLTLALGAVRRARRAVDPWARAVALSCSGLIAFEMINFLYGDAGGAAAVLSGLILGVVMSCGLPEPADPAGPAAPADPADVALAAARPPALVTGGARC